MPRAPDPSGLRLRAASAWWASCFSAWRWPVTACRRPSRRSRRSPWRARPSP